MFLTDLPIEKVDDDILGRGIFAHRIAESIMNYQRNECLTIGIYGGWGNGKTSLANMILNEIIEKDNDSSNPKYCIIRFNPWLFANQKDLITQLFSSISEAFKYSDPNSIKDKLADSISWFGRAAKAIGHIPGIGTIANDISDIFDDYSKMLKGEKPNKDEYESLYQLKFKISETLKKENIKLIISIDDFDRLSQEEIRLMFQVVKVLGDFNNTVYLLSFDKDVVVVSLKDVQGGDGDDYLKKIIQVPITLPPIRKNVIKEITFEKFNSIINFSSLSDKDKSKIKNLSDNLFKVLSPYIDNIRDINRLINLFEFKYGFLKDEINPLDLLALCAIEIFENTKYNLIIHYKDKPSKANIDSNIYVFLSGKKSGVENTFDKPGFNNRFYQNERINLFFSFELPAQYISVSEKEAIIYKYDLETIENILDSHLDDIPGLVDSIQWKIPEIPSERCSFVFQTLALCSLKSQISINRKIKDTSLALIKKMNQDDLEEIFSNYMQQGIKIALIPLFTYILFYLESKNDSNLKKNLLRNNDFNALNIETIPNIDLDKIEECYINSISQINIFDLENIDLEKLYLLCKKIDINYLKQCIPSDYSQNKAAISIICYEIEEKVENTNQGQKLLFHVNIGEIKKLLDLQCLKEYLKNKDKLPLNSFTDNIILKIKAFLICEEKKGNLDGIYKLDYEEDLQKMSLDEFWG